jgi:membrane protease YdiL (CAAX protease family)
MLRMVSMNENLNGYTYPETTKFKCLFNGIAIPLLSMVVGAALAAIVMLISGVSIEQLQEYIKTNDSIKLLIIQNIVVIAILLPLYLKEKKYKPEPSMKISGIEYFIYGVMVLASLFMLTDALKQVFISLTGSNMEQHYKEVTSAMLDAPKLLPKLIAIGLLAPVAEEFIFRGIMQDRLSSKFNKYVAIVISSVLFGLIHGNMSQFIAATIGGLGMGYFYMLTGSLMLTIITHIVNNVIAVLEPYILEVIPYSALQIFWAVLFAFGIFYFCKARKKAANA